MSGALADCSLVVPTFERAAEVVRLLNRLVYLPDQPGEVVVVDGSPSDTSRDAIALWAKGRSLRFALLYVKSDTGLTRQRNVGIDTITRPLVFFLDDDCLPEAGYFSALRTVFAEDRDGRVGAVCGSIINEMGGQLSWRWRLRFLLGLAPRHGTPGRYYATATSVPRSLAAPFTGTREVDIVPGGATAYRRDVFETERFSLFFHGYAQGEDLEMSRRLARKWALLWCGDARVRHEHAAAGRPDILLKGAMEVRNRYFIWKRHSPEARGRERLQFWADIAYVFGYDIALFATGRWAARPFRHALGVARGVWDCLSKTVRYEEPPAHREYEVVWGDPPRVEGTA